MGDDTLYGEEGADVMYGDGAYGQELWGDDIMFGGAGEDEMYGGIGDDVMYGGADDDVIYGEQGDDIIYGDGGDDLIESGTGWDTIYGGEGCDSINVNDGGDVVWLGDCDGTEGDQTVIINGTGEDATNYTVVMDFWLATAVESNQICIGDPSI